MAQAVENGQVGWEGLKGSSRSSWVPYAYSYYSCPPPPPIRRNQVAGPAASGAPNIFNISAAPVRRVCLLALVFIANTYIVVSFSDLFSEATSDTANNTIYSVFSQALNLLLNMVSGSYIGGLAARASVFFISTKPLVQRADAAAYTNNAATAITTLQNTWYNVGTGIWDNAWWNSANVLTTLADFALLDLGRANQLNIGGIMRNTFDNAQKVQATATKFLDASGLVSSTYAIQKRELWSRQFRANGFPGFINEFYDDEGWWCLGLIRAYDVTGDQDYLNMAVTIFNDMKTGGNTNCGGGIYWNKDRKYVNAIANELYLSCAAALANRMPNKQDYLAIAIAQWNWFKTSGMINAEGTINDGLTPDCKNNNGNTWSYNQGVILGGLVELNRATGDSGHLTDASRIAYAAIKKLSDANGILHDSCEPNCGADGNQFKGVFMRNLHYLQKAATQDPFRTFILKNADSIWEKNRDANNKLGVVWSGPVQGASGPAHSSALDAIVGAIAVA